MFEIIDLKLNHKKKPIGLSSLPKLSWKLNSNQRDVVQTHYQVQISTQMKFNDVKYDSKLVKSNESINVELPQLEIVDFKKYYIRVKSISNKGEESKWFISFFITGYVNQAIKASMITIEDSIKLNHEETFYARKEFESKKNIESAYCTATAFGLYKLYLNGDRVGDYQLTPGWTSYNKHLIYQIYDVTELIRNGENTIGAMVGVGWYKGSFGFNRKPNLYGDKAGFLCELHINYSDGSQSVIRTDTSWKGHLSPILMSNLYDGEYYDANREIDNWCLSNLDTTDWLGLTTIDFNHMILKEQVSEPVRVIEQIQAEKLFRTPENDLVIDFGQNMSGLVQISVTGMKGDQVELNFFEVLDAEHNVYIDNLRGAEQKVTYVFGEKEDVVYIPSFTFQGFRYARINKFPGQAKIDNFIALAISSSMEMTGRIETSNKTVNQLVHNILWGLNSNFVDIPTDCPQRDERMGWTGDAQVFARTACYFKNCYNFYKKYMIDLAHDQTSDGGVPHVVPDILSGNSNDDKFLSEGAVSAAGWADAAVIIPWTLYQVYGDEDILVTQYESMKAWIDFMKNHSEDYIWSYNMQFGDWVALDAKEGSYFGATPNDLICTAYSAYSTSLFVKTAKVLNKQKDAEIYSDYLNKIINKYHSEFIDDAGCLKAQTQTAHILSLYFDLLPEDNKEIAIKNLVGLLDKENGHLVTGFLGTPYFCSVLSNHGKYKEAYDLFLKDDFPSWLYQVNMGATTIWEHWDGVKPDGSMWSPDMNSFNHYAYGAIGEWIQRTMIGIELDESDPAYHHYYIQPIIDKRFTYAKGSLMSQYGMIESKWELYGDRVKLSIKVPVNTRCTINLRQAIDIMDNNTGQTFLEMDLGFSVCVGSGEYKVEYLVNIE